MIAKLIFLVIVLIHTTLINVGLTTLPTQTDKAKFIAGYNKAGYNLQYREHFVSDVIFCESRWNKWAVNQHSGALGLSQFLPENWIQISKKTGYFKWWQAFDQGYNTSYWTSITDNPSEQWGCW